MKWLHRILDKTTPLALYHEDAKRWSSCAVGEFTEAFPKTPGVRVVFLKLERATSPTEPTDKRLYTLGAEFERVVRSGDRKKALKVYRAIETRIIHLMSK